MTAQRILLIATAGGALVVGTAIGVPLVVVDGATATITADCWVDGAQAVCPPRPAWAPPEAVDVDGQPRPFAYQTVTWLPQIGGPGPECEQHTTVNDPTSDEVYEGGCEPVAFQWQNAGRANENLLADGNRKVTLAFEPEAAAAQLVASYALFKTGTVYKKWARDNAKEAAAADAYWAAPAATQPVLSTITGHALIVEADAYHFATGDHP